MYRWVREHLVGEVYLSLTHGAGSKQKQKQIQKYWDAKNGARNSKRDLKRILEREQNKR